MDYSEKQIAEIYSKWFKKLQSTGQNHNDFLPVLIRATRIYFGIDEEWRDITKYKGYYKGSNFGRVKSLDRIIRNNKGFTKRKSKILSQSICSQGYLRVSLCKNNICKKIRIHVIICKLFHHGVKATTNHKDGIKTNNFYLNLEFATYSENSLHAYRIGLRMPPLSMLGKRGSNNPKSKSIIQMDLNGKIIDEHQNSIFASNKTGASTGNIWSACNNERKTAGGFKWKYKNK